MTRICAVIPAAGRGSRLGLDVPKILVPVDQERTVWDVLRDNLSPIVERIHIVLAPSAMADFSGKLQSDSEREKITVSEQREPLGMGDAIFGAERFWAGYDSILIVWGDQVNLSSSTLEKAAALSNEGKTVVLPLVECKSPYVQYDESDGILKGVRQSREGDQMDLIGNSDVGLFILSVPELLDCWHRFVKESIVGAQTKELNFLPFLPFLSLNCGWKVRVSTVNDPTEAIGINTKEELAFTRERFARLKGNQSLQQEVG